VQLESYAFVLLRRPARAPVYRDDELELIQAAHLAHLDALRETGKLVGAGPFSDQADESVRGSASSLRRSRRLASWRRVIPLCSRAGSKPR
jgi:hypothetical protein